MKTNLLLSTALLLFGFADLKAGGNPPASLSGTYLVGNSQPVFKKLTDVANALNTAGNTVTGNIIFELDSDYDGTTGEMFPITFNQFTTSGGNWTVTIRPRAGVSLRTTSGDPGSAAALIMLDKADNLRLDGRAGGTGNDIGWLIRNSRTGSDAGSAVYLQNDALFNVFTYLQLEAQSSDLHSVVYLGAGLTQGNDNNTISYCTISGLSNGTGMTAACIISKGTPGNNFYRFNSDNIILHNNITNFYSSGMPAYGVYLATGTTQTQVTYNNFYNTQPVTGATAGTVLYAVYINEPAVYFTSVSVNAIGGSAPGCAGAPFSVAGANVRFGGIVFHNTQPSTIPGTDNRITGNIIRNLQIESDTAPAAGQLLFTGIQVSIGHVGITDNIIGSSTENDDIQLSVGGVNPFSASMIHFTSRMGGYITGNKIGGITFSGGLVSSSASTINGIYVMFTTANPETIGISNNLIGSATVINSIRSVSGTMLLGFTGINTSVNSPSIVNYKNNTIAGVLLDYSGTVPADLMGIRHANTASSVIDSNTVSDLSAASMAVTNLISFEGIHVASGNAVISNNTIRRLRRTATGPLIGTPGSVIGGIFVGQRDYSAQVYNNLIYDLTSANDLGAMAATGLAGIHVFRPAVVYNNIISLDNGANTNNCGITGISMATSVVTVKVFHNTVYIGGSNPEVPNAARSVIMSGVPSTASGTFDVRNNIFVNARTGGNNQNYIYYNPTASPATNWPDTAIDYNVLLIADVTRIARWQSSDLDSAQWRTGGDMHSSFYAVSQLAPSALFTDLTRLEIKNDARGYVSGRGVSGTGISTDFAGKSRSTTAPTRGAYEYPTAVLKNLVVSEGVLSPLFDWKINAYADTVSSAINSMTVTPTALDASATITVNGVTVISGNASDAIPLAVGTNTITVVVTAGGGLTETYTITVVSSNPPVITSHGGASNVNLNQPENTTAVTIVTATDDDVPIMYSIVDDLDGAKFSVNSATGELSFIGAPDFERPADADENNLYFVMVKASAGSLSAVQRFKIKVTNVNDNPPAFNSHHGEAAVTLRLPENSIAVTTVLASDRDAGTTIVYSILNDQDGGSFSINPVTGELVFINAPDFEQPGDTDGDNVYIVTVQASDGSLTALQRFKLKITDVNEDSGRLTSRIAFRQETVVTETITSNGIKIYPNPVPGKRLMLRMDSIAAGRYTAEVYTTTGELVYRQQLDHTGKSIVYPIQLPPDLAPGMYILKLRGMRTAFTTKLVVE